LVEIAPQTNDEVKTVEDHYAQTIKSTIDSFFNDNKKELNIIPKKSNIDLKRNLLPKWEKLDKKTEIAIIELLSKNFYCFFFLSDLEKKIGGENIDKTEKNEKPVKKEMEFSSEEKKFQTIFNADLVYDEEMYNKFNEGHEIQEDEELDPATGTNLVSALNMQDNLYEVKSFFFIFFVFIMENLNIKAINQDFENED